jgi:hypothetical protein
VLFPGGRLPLRLFERRYLDMASACMRNRSPFGVCLIREGAEVGPAATPHEVGTLATIAEWDMQQLGVLQIVAQGGERFRVRAARTENELIRADVDVLPAESDSGIPESCAICVRLLERVIEEQPALLERPHRLDSSAWVSARLAELLPLPLELKQELLETDGPARLERLGGLLKKAP